MVQAIPLATDQLNIPTVEPLGPLDAAAKALSIQKAQQDVSLGGIALQQHKQTQKDESDLRSAAQQAEGDPDKIQEILNTSNPRAAATWAQELATRRKLETDNQKDQLANAQTKLGMISSAVQDVTDDASLQRAKTRLSSTLGPQAASLLPDKYDPAQIKQITDQALSHKDWLDAQAKATDAAQNAQKIADEEGKDSVAARQSWEQSLAHAFYGTSSQQDHDNVLNTYSKLGAPKDLLALYGQTWSPDVPKKAAAVLGPDALKVQSETAAMPQSKDEAASQLLAAFGGNPNDPSYKAYANQLAAMRYSPTAGAALVQKAQQETQNVREAGARVAAEEPTEVAKAKALADLQSGGNDPRLAPVAPKYRDEALKAFGKVQDTYNAAQDARDRINTVLNLAKSGNKEAQASAPLIAVQAINEMAGVKRVNGTEIANYGNAGSLIDQLQGKLGKIMAGQSIPPDVLTDMQSLHDAFAQNADKAYARSVGTLNGRYNAKFDTKPTGSASVTPDKKNPFRQ